MNSGVFTCQLGVAPYWNIALISSITICYHSLALLPMPKQGVLQRVCHGQISINLLYLYTHTHIYIYEQFGIAHFHNLFD